MNKTGIGTRVLNFLADTILIALISYFVYKVHVFYVFNYKVAAHPFYQWFWLVMFIYYTLFEAIFTRTPGKFMSYSKVVNSKTGKRPNILQVILRSLVRLTIIDMFFIPLLDKTLHDALSGTDVVEV